MTDTGDLMSQGSIVAAISADATSRQGRGSAAALDGAAAQPLQQAPLATIAKVLLGLELDYSETALRLGRHLAAQRWHAAAAPVLRPASARISGANSPPQAAAWLQRAVLVHRVCHKLGAQCSGVCDSLCVPAVGTI